MGTFTNEHETVVHYFTFLEGMLQGNRVMPHACKLGLFEEHHFTRETLIKIGYIISLRISSENFHLTEIRKKRKKQEPIVKLTINKM